MKKEHTNYLESKDSIEEKTLNVILKISIIFIIILIISDFIIINSEDYITRNYNEFHNYKFEGEIFEKKQDQKGSGANIARYLHLKSGIIHRINVDKFYKLNVGDYVYKKTKSDTVYYILSKNKDTLKYMENDYLKEYLELNK